MAIFSFLSGKYKPSYFKGKTVEEILKNVDLSKVDKDSITASDKDEEKEIYANLDPDIIALIDMLIDYKNKDGKKIIYDLCYKGKGKKAAPAAAMPMGAAAAPGTVRPKSFRRPLSLPKPMPAAPAAAALVATKTAPPAPAPAKVEEETASDDTPSEEGQSGGRRRRRKHGKKGTRKHGKKGRKGKRKTYKR